MSTHCGYHSIREKRSRTNPSSLSNSGCKQSDGSNGCRSPDTFRFGSSATGNRQLWTSSRVDTQILRLFYFRGNCNSNPRITVTEKILKLGHSRLSDGTTIGENLRLCGRTFYDADADEFVIILEELAAADIEVSKFRTPVRLCTEMASAMGTGGTADYDDDDGDGLCAVSRLRRSIAIRDQISLDRFVALLRAKCIYRLESCRSVSFAFRLDVLTPSITFEASPLDNPLPSVIPTALARGLADPVGNVFLHSQPKSGYVTVDERKRLLFILDSDPKVVSLPLVGVWTSGVKTVRHPFVWAACVRYVYTSGLADASQMPSTPFVLIVYDRLTFRPRFYECIVLQEASTSVRALPCTSFVGRTSGVLSIYDGVKFGNDVVYTGPLLESHEFNNNDFTADDYDRNDMTVTPRHRLSFAASLDGKPATKNLSMIRTTNDKGGSSTTTTEPCNISSPIPPEVMRFLAAQEQKLDELRRRVDDLMKAKTSLTSGAEKGVSVAVNRSSRLYAISSDTENCEETKAIIKVSSTATMTSFAFPPMILPLQTSPLALCSALIDYIECHSVEPKVMQCKPVEKGKYDGEPSMEYPREGDCRSRADFQSSTTFSSSFENSLADLKLDSTLFETSAVDCQRRPRQLTSPLLIDLPDYNPESPLSYRYHESFTSSPSFEHLSSLENRNPDAHFYSNLLKRIETILSHQSTDDKLNWTKHDIRTSVFDSIYLPRLNYVSLRLGGDERECDRSAQFGSIARKYLVDWQPEETEISLGTRRYLNKYRLQ